MNILWKEWCQQRLLFLAGAGLGFLFPLFDSLSRDGRGTGSIIVMAFGALFALILAVATTHDDVQHGISEFWQSRPVAAGRIFSTKLLLGVGLLFVGFAFMTSLDFASMTTWMDPRRFAWNALTVTWPVAVLLFSMAMFLTVWLRDPARSVMVAIWALLLVYTLPLLVDGLRWMNLFDMLREGGRGNPSILMDALLPAVWPRGHTLRQVVSDPAHDGMMQWLTDVVRTPEYTRYLVFVAAMLAGAAACLALSIAAVKRNWHWQPGQKTLAWTIGLSVAVIFSLAMFQVGHNLEPATTYNGQPIDPILRFASTSAPTYDWVGSPTNDLRFGYTPPGWPSPRLCTDGPYLYAVASGRRSSDTGPNSQILDICRFPDAGGHAGVLSRTRFAASPPPARNNARWAITAPTLSAASGRLFVAYQVYLPAAVDQPAGMFSLRMLVADVTDPAHPKRIADEELGQWRNQVFQSKGSSAYGHFCYIWGERELLVVSLADPQKPKIARRIPTTDLGMNGVFIDQADVTGRYLLGAGPRDIALLDLADPQAPRLVFRHTYRRAEDVERSGRIGAAIYADNLLYVATESGLEIHRLQPAASGQFQAELIGQRNMTPLERVAGRSPHELLLRQGLLYEADDNFGMLVYDVSDPSQPRRAYHAVSHDYITAIGIWNGLLYMNGSLGTLTLVPMP